MIKNYLEKANFLVCKHAAAIILSMLIGFVLVAPQLWFIHNLGNNYHGIYMTGADAELHYLARTQESVDGGGLGNPYIFEFKNTFPSTLYAASETILGLPTRLFNVSVPVMNLFYKFLLPAIIALLAYGLAYRLTGDRLWSVASMVIIVLGPTLINLTDIIHLFRWEKVYTQFALYSRPINPEFSSVIFLLYLHVLLTALRRKTWTWFFALAALLGLSFYVYLYSYTFFLALNFVVLCIYGVNKERDIVLRILTATAAGVAIGYFSIANTIKLYQHSYFKEMAELSGIVISHHPIISAVGIIALVVFFVLAFKYKEYPDLRFLGALLATSFIVVNQQIITGILVQEGHYHWYFNVPIFLLTFMVAWYYFVGRKYKRAGVAFVAIVCLAAVGSVALIQISSYEYWAPRIAVAQRYAPVLSWLKEKTPKESVVLADQALSELIPVYTSDNVVWEEHAAFYLMPTERRNFTPENILASSNLKNALSKYRVDYLVWDAASKPEWKLDRYSFLKKVYDDGGFKIYGR